MRYFHFLFFIRLLTLIILIYNCDGYANIRRFKYDLVDFYLSEKNQSKLSLKLLWNHVIGCGSCAYCMNLYPAYENSYIFAMNHCGIVKKLNFYTGECIWLKNLSSVYCNSFFFKFSDVASLSGGLVVNKGFLYFGSELSKVYALDTNTGAILWVSRVSGEVISKPVVSRGLVLVYTSNGVFQALDEKNGMIRWSISFEVPTFSFRVTLLPFIFGDIVVIGGSSGIVSACYIDTGELIWQKKISTLKGFTDIDRLSNVVAPVVVDNVVYAVAYNGNMEALDIFSGGLIWSKNIGSLTNFIVKDNFIYLIDQDSRVVALNKIDGNIVWSKSNLMCRGLISIVLYKNYILIGDTKGYLYCLYKKDGTFLGRKRIGVNPLNYLSIIFNKIVFYESNGRLSVWSLFSNDL